MPLCLSFFYCPLSPIVAEPQLIWWSVSNSWGEWWYILHEDHIYVLLHLRLSFCTVFFSIVSVFKPRMRSCRSGSCVLFPNFWGGRDCQSWFLPEHYDGRCHFSASSQGKWPNWKCYEASPCLSRWWLVVCLLRWVGGGKSLSFQKAFLTYRSS